MYKRFLDLNFIQLFQPFTKNQIFTKLPQISHINKNRIFKRKIEKQDRPTIFTL